MTVVDLDFEEQLKETNFPDLLDGVHVVDDSELLRKKASSRRKVAKETKKSVEMRKTENQDLKMKRKVGVPPQDSRTQGIVPTVDPKKLPRVSVDPPISQERVVGINHHAADKRSIPPTSKLVSDNIGKLLTPPPDISVDKKEMYHEAKGSNIRRTDKVDKKPLHKSIKRDFIEQVSYEVDLSKKKIELPVSTSRKTSPVSTSRNEKGEPSSPIIHANAIQSSPKTHEINELDIQRKDSSVSSIHAEESDEDGDNDAGQGNEEKQIASTNKNIHGTANEAQDLLERARDRIARQRLVEQVKALEMIVERKNIELEQLNSQLRRAVETKSELVIAHNEIEKRHAMIVEKKEQNLLRMKQANIWLLEAQSIKEKELLNEIIRLTDMTRDAEQKRREELDDWERMHRNEMLEKDYMIARLSEELRQLGVNAESPIFKQQQKNKGMYDPTSIITGASKFFFH